MNDTISKLINFAFVSQNELQFLHWTTLSYEKHVALGKTYDAITEKFDRLIETAISKYSRIQNITLTECTFDSNVQYANFITGKIKTINDLRKSLPESDFQNQLDSITEDFRQLAYLLTLK